MKRIAFYLKRNRDMISYREPSIIPRKGETVMFEDMGRKTKVYTVTNVMHDYNNEEIRVSLK